MESTKPTSNTFVPFPDLVEPQPDKKRITPLVIAVIIFILSGSSFYLIKTYYPPSNLASESSLSLEPTPTPTPIPLYPDEGTAGNFSVSQGSKSPGPRITKVRFDPLVAEKGMPLTITAGIATDKPTTMVEGILQTDTGSTQLTFLKQDSSDPASEVWSSTIPLTDSVLYRYILTLKATNADGTSQVVVAPRS